MNGPDTTRNLALQDARSDTHSCGCGGCGSTGTSTDMDVAKSRPTPGPSTRSFEVSGMTCGHCASAVTTELKALAGVEDVQVDLVADGTSRVTVTAETLPTRDHVVAALDEAGGYQLA